ncbi:MAG: DUF2281 domain-containing protein [Cyanobacteria bacterium J06650_10]
MASLEIRDQIRQKIDQLLPEQLSAINEFIDFLQFKKKSNAESQQSDETPSVAKKRTPGLHPGAFVISEDFDAPLPDSFWLGEE